MTLEAQIRTRMTEVGYASEEAKFLRTVLGELQLEQNRPGFDDNKALGIIKKSLAGNEETRGYLKDGDNRLPRLAWEDDILKTFLPSYLSVDEIRKLLEDAGATAQIVSSDNEGKAMGMAMKSLKAAGAVVEGGTVKEVVQGLRS